MGLLHELELSEGGHRYELLSNENADHHHLSCITLIKELLLRISINF